MRSIKTKVFSLAMAGGMLLALAGCNMSAPSTVGNIGGVEIPSGLYLLMQYNAYNTAASKATLPEGKKSDDVKAVLKAECTGTIGDEEVTATGAEYIQKLTDPLDAAKIGEWVTIDLGSSILVARRLDPLKTGASVSEMVKTYDLLTAMKSTDMQNEMYAAGAALEHNLDASAVKTYAASKI